MPWICSIVVWKSYHLPVSVCTGAVWPELGGIRVQVGALLVCACGVEWTGVKGRFE